VIITEIPAWRVEANVVMTKALDDVADTFPVPPPLMDTERFADGANNISG